MYKNVTLCVLLFALLDTMLSSPVSLKNEIDEIKSDIADLQKQNQELDTRLTASKYETAVLVKQLDQLTHKFVEVTEKQDQDENDNENNRNVHRISKRNVRRRRVHAIRRKRHLTEIGFQASLTSQTQDLKHGEPIKFNHVITHFSNAYNPKTGIFTTPIAGTYMFNVNIVAETGFYIEAGIQVNNKPTVTAVSDHMPSKGANTATWDQGTVSAILKLKSGDKVSVVLQWPKGFHSIHGLGTTNFSGYLLKQHLVNQ